MKIAASAAALALSFGLGAVTTGMNAKPADAATTPPGCVRFMQISEDLFGSSADQMYAVTDALTALQNGNSRNLKRAVDDINTSTEKLQAATPKIEAAGRDCKAGK